MTTTLLDIDFDITFGNCNTTQFAELEAEVAAHFARPNPGPFRLVLDLDPPITLRPPGSLKRTTYGATRATRTTTRTRARARSA